MKRNPSIGEAFGNRRRTHWLEEFSKDLSYAARTLTRDFRFSTAALLILAMGIGLNTATFSVLNPVLFRSLPFERPEELLYLNESNLKLGFKYLSMSYADFCDWRQQNRTFTDLGIFGGAGFTISGKELAERVDGQRISATLFAVLGSQPLLGRTFTQAEDQPGAVPVVMLSHGLWQRRFGGNPEIIGQTVTLNGVGHTVVGVMPPGFGFPANSELWTPLVVGSPENNRGSHSYSGIGRLKPGTTLRQAREDLVSISARLAQEHPAECANVTALVQPLREAFLGGVQATAWITLGAVGFVLAVACANVSNLFLARALGRQKEFAIRTALGATRGRMVRQLLVESLLLAIVAGTLGVGLTVWGRDLLLAMIPTAEIPHWIHFGIDWRVLGFALGLSLLTCLLFGLAPALHVVRHDAHGGLQQTGRGAGEARGRNRLRGVLVASEVALAVLLLCGTGLMWKSVVNLQKVNPGFTPAQLGFFYLDLPATRYDKPEERIGFYARVLERLGALPGIQSVAAVSSPPMGDNNNGFSYIIEGRPTPLPGQVPVGNTRVASPGYFATMKIPLLQGRDFTTADTANSSMVIVIDATLARQFFTGQNPIGQRIKFGASPEAASPWMEIIGVAGEVKHYGLDQDIRPGFYVPHAQNAWANMSIVMRTKSGNPLALLPSVRETVREFDPTLAISRPMAMPDNIQRTFWMKRLMSQLFGVFSLLSLGLAVAGIAGVVLYAVTQRTHEIGVRMALGATERDALQLVLKQAMQPVVGGLGLGLLASLALARVLTSQLYQVSGTDLGTLAASSLILSTVALVACYFPARRAARINPMEALRAE